MAMRKNKTVRRLARGAARAWRAWTHRGVAFLTPHARTRARCIRAESGLVKTLEGLEIE